jgi:hypothetical protein
MYLKKYPIDKILFAYISPSKYNRSYVKYQLSTFIYTHMKNDFIRFSIEFYLVRADSLNLVFL